MDALEPGYRPSSRLFTCGISYFTAVITLEAHGKGTKYTALAIHKDEEGRKKHEEMGFYDGWGTALDQLVAVAKKMRS
ncbi:MAG: SRPBCC domain-containing protein [Burkholderiales bacterium]